MCSRVFYELQGVWKLGQTQSNLFDISSQSKLELRRKQKNKIIKSMLINFLCLNMMNNQWVWEETNQPNTYLLFSGVKRYSDNNNTTERMINDAKMPFHEEASAIVFRRKTQFCGCNIRKTTISKCMIYDAKK